MTRSVCVRRRREREGQCRAEWGESDRPGWHDLPRPLSASLFSLFSLLSPYRKGVFFFQILYSSFTRRSSTSSEMGAGEVGRGRGVIVSEDTGRGVRELKKRRRAPMWWGERDAQEAQGRAVEATRPRSPSGRTPALRAAACGACVRGGSAGTHAGKGRHISFSGPPPLRPFSSQTYRGSLPLPGRCPWLLNVCACVGGEGGRRGREPARALSVKNGPLSLSGSERADGGGRANDYKTGSGGVDTTPHPEFLSCACSRPRWPPHLPYQRTQRSTTPVRVAVCVCAACEIGPRALALLPLFVVVFFPLSGQRRAEEGKKQYHPSSSAATRHSIAPPLFQMGASWSAKAASPGGAAVPDPAPASACPVLNPPASSNMPPAPATVAYDVYGRRLDEAPPGPLTTGCPEVDQVLKAGAVDARNNVRG